MKKDPRRRFAARETIKKDPRREFADREGVKKGAGWSLACAVKGEKGSSLVTCMRCKG